MRPIQAGAGWALRELWRGVTEVLAALFQAAGNPVGFALPGLLAVSLLFAIGAGVEAVKGAKVVNEAREGYWTQYGVFYREVERQRALPQRLIEQGGNAAVLEDALLAYDRARGSEAKKVAAERLAAMMAAEYALLETRGELPHAVRQSMKTKVTGLMERRRALDGAELRWREAGATSRGRLALALGRAEAAPLVAVDR